MDRARGVAEPTPVTPHGLHRQLRIDALLRGTAMAAIAVMVLLIAILPAEHGDLTGSLLLLLCGGMWLALSLTTARTARQLAGIHDLGAGDPDKIETLLRDLMRRRPLHRSVRLLLYYRFTALRHRQQRFDRSLPLAHAILGQRHGVPREARVHLLLMLVESHLYRGDVWDAYHGLAALHSMPLNLNESLERMALQVNYEVAIGRDDLPLDAITTTLEMAELLPPPLCGAMHATLWGAATRCGRAPLADWLLSRAGLLCSDEQIQSVARGHWIPKVAERAG